MESADSDPYSWPYGHFINILLQAPSADILLDISVLIVLLVLSALVSGSEVAYFSLRPADTEKLGQESSGSSETILQLINRPKRLLAVILIANNLLNIAAVILSAYITFKLFDFSHNPALGFIIQIVAVTFILVLVGEILPKIYATQNSLTLARLMAYPLFILDKIFYPFTFLMVKSTNLIEKRLAQSGYEVTMDELTHAIDITSDITTPPDEKKILKSIVSFGDIDVRQIMKPRMDVIAYDVEISFGKLLNNIIEHGHSRVPIYEGNLDKVVGILYIKDLIKYIGKEDDFKWQFLLRQPFFVPESKKINDLLHEFQEKKMHMAIVVDEYGGSSGVVTLEDVLEEIVGEINDELDEEELIYSKLDNDNFVFEGKALLNDVSRVLEVERKDFEDMEGDIDTVAGLLLELFGKIPERNERIEHNGFRFTVELVDKRRIKRVKITRIKPEEVLGKNNNRNGGGMNSLTLFIISGIIFFLLSCDGDYTPKPRGYFRIEVPDKSYAAYEPAECPYTFEVPTYTIVEIYDGKFSEPCWINIKYPQLSAEINISYKAVKDDLPKYLEDSRTLAYKHTVRAEAINEKLIETEHPDVNGIYYELEGNTASAVQFFVTDSTRHFLRGSLYFNVAPQRDSLDPVIDFIKEDIVHLINTLQWK
ncbi:MAG: gliding motility lipoprotein GldD [Bacteroidia bacterium]